MLRFLRGGQNLSALASWSVFGFFFMSGFLVGNSSWKKNALDFVFLRLLRLLPSLLVVLLLTSLLVGPAIGFLEGRPAFGYSNITYLDNFFLPLKLQHELGTVLEGLPYSASINGSLWTLPVEVRLYAVTLTITVFARSNLAKKLGLNSRTVYVISSGLLVLVQILVSVSGIFRPQLGETYNWILVSFAAGLFLSSVAISSDKASVWVYLVFSISLPFVDILLTSVWIL